MKNRMQHSHKKERLHLGIIFNFKSVWMGGIIYIINIVNTLNHLEDKDKPEIFLFYHSKLHKFLKEFDYPYLNCIEWNFLSLTKGTIKSKLLRKNLFIEALLKKYSLDAVFPLQDYPVRTKTTTKLISWTPDFQHKHYSEFFTKRIMIGRAIRIKQTLRNNNNLVLSSYDAYKDLKRFYNVRKGFRVHIFHFVSIIDNLDMINPNDLRAKYDLPEHYFLVSNQFHKHKNHKVLLLAIAKLKQLGVIKHLAFTGKLPSADGSPYLTELYNIIEKNKLQNQISLLGIIPRNDQLQIMKFSQAVLQPSLFEGWSTVIEDAKSLQVPVIASNLNVNIEQLGDKGIYFSPHNPDELVSILKDYPERNYDDQLYEEYLKRARHSAETLLKIFKTA